MKKTALVIMAAGLGARFGGGIKQLEPLGPDGECIMMYSIHDAIEAGFNQIVFILREELEAEFRRLAGGRIEEACSRLGVEVRYAYQSTLDLPSGFLPVNGRTKPWGTGQAVLCAAKLIEGPFAVINADDHYGKASFRKLYAWLTGAAQRRPDELCMVGFLLGNTLSENGGVTRGICRVGPSGTLLEIYETKNIVSKDRAIFANGIPIHADTCVSMNMWGFPQGFLKVLEDGFARFLRTAAKKQPLAAEYLLPVLIGELLEAGQVSVQVLETADRWFGITYQEDKAFVRQAFQQLLEQGAYPAKLFSGLKPCAVTAMEAAAGPVTVEVPELAMTRR